jgi:pilus assembly protein Flp/PilA
MRRIKTLALSFVREEDGATMIEYALLAVLIAMVVAIAAITLGQAISNQFNVVSTCVNAPSSANCSTLYRAPENGGAVGSGPRAHGFTR